MRMRSIFCTVPSDPFFDGWITDHGETVMQAHNMWLDVYFQLGIIGLVLVALTVVPSTAGPDLAVMHLVSHVAFKALLFLMIGWLTVLVGGTGLYIRTLLEGIAGTNLGAMLLQLPLALVLGGIAVLIWVTRSRRR